MARNRPLRQLSLQRGLNLAQTGSLSEPPIAKAVRKHCDDCGNLRLRRNQEVHLNVEGLGNVCIVLDGILMLECNPTSQRRRILRLFYPGNVMRASHAPHLNNLKMVAAVPAQLIQLQWHTFETLLREEKTVSDLYHKQFIDQDVRAILHDSGFGVLSGDERVAALIIEFALKLGRKSSGGITFEVPLTRSEMADYLALNPDTMSRIMSRMKAKGIFTQLSRVHAVIPNIEALFEVCPISPALVELNKP